MNPLRETVVLTPALNEEQTVEEAVRGFMNLGSRVLVVDNGSVDRTGARALRAGADVVVEPRRGYGSACLAGLQHLSVHPPRYVVFADADGSCPVDALPSLVDPLAADSADLVLGVRRSDRTMPLTQSMGNHAACVALRLLFDLRVTDVPPMRALRWSTVESLGLSDRSYGLPIETIARSAQRGLRLREVAVNELPRRGGRSKVGGTLLGTVGAAGRMVSVCLRLRLSSPG
jgi:Glycosyl transferase family 2